MYQPKEVGRRLLRMRKAHGYSREKIAESIGRSVKYYGDIERGSCGMSVDTLIRLADFYRVSLDYLMTGEDGTYNEKDEHTKWVMRTICRLEEPKKNAIIDMVKLVVEQWEESRY